MADALYSLKETAEILNVHWQTVRSYIKNGSLKAVKVGRAYRIREKDIDTLLGKRSKEQDKVEIEVRFVTKNRRAIEQRLIKLGAKVTHHSHIIDHWFSDKTVKSLTEKDVFYESDDGYGLRIRELDNGYTGKMSTVMEIKKLAVPGDHSTCIEHEITVPDYEHAKRFLALMVMKEFATVDKDRVVYAVDDYKIAIDTIKDYKTAVEIEMMTDEDKKVIIPQLLDFAQKLGLDPKKDRVEKSVTYEFMVERSRF
ncbi:helix-turn-helix domain-containing protein [candidate division WWE3 bacterium]|uniref:Helix-turn-helix domain-containing protein n=1 Tax=candidate division WWE3 bacterium TaxID=2053526 RepID=A0A955RRM9_UNCKA|nr:helix-turn-helix domain-containing protein [candidate division WWE3 bacterium]